MQVHWKPFRFLAVKMEKEMFLELHHHDLRDSDTFTTLSVWSVTRNTENLLRYTKYGSKCVKVKITQDELTM
ncbi:CLUMA_CG013910, isoform A [Clunio marinus]|uniref:CLUMA_CG013910, isoform A n=1 Tax=Clunio marinus TaxID=568069 RepID=A0A1J1ILL9_9DIPT|nr:CLUMA_CG013910, isoform A [Clunio marinus]